MSGPEESVAVRHRRQSLLTISHENSSGPANNLPGLG